MGVHGSLILHISEQKPWNEGENSSSKYPTLPIQMNIPKNQQQCVGFKEPTHMTVMSDGRTDG